MVQWRVKKLSLILGEKLLFNINLTKFRLLFIIVITNGFLLKSLPVNLNLPPLFNKILTNFSSFCSSCNRHWCI